MTNTSQLASSLLPLLTDSVERAYASSAKSDKAVRKPLASVAKKLASINDNHAARLNKSSWADSVSAWDALGLLEEIVWDELIEKVRPAFSLEDDAGCRRIILSAAVIVITSHVFPDTYQLSEVAAIRLAKRVRLAHKRLQTGNNDDTEITTKTRRHVDPSQEETKLSAETKVEGTLPGITPFQNRELEKLLGHKLTAKEVDLLRRFNDLTSSEILNEVRLPENGEPTYRELAELLGFSNQSIMRVTDGTQEPKEKLTLAVRRKLLENL